MSIHIQPLTIYVPQTSTCLSIFAKVNYVPDDFSRTSGFLDPIEKMMSPSKLLAPWKHLGRSSTDELESAELAEVLISLVWTPIWPLQHPIVFFEKEVLTLFAWEDTLKLTPTKLIKRPLDLYCAYPKKVCQFPHHNIDSPFQLSKFFIAWLAWSFRDSDWTEVLKLKTILVEKEVDQLFWFGSCISIEMFFCFLQKELCVLLVWVGLVSNKMAFIVFCYFWLLRRVFRHSMATFFCTAHTKFRLERHIWRTLGFSNRVKLFVTFLYDNNQNITQIQSPTFKASASWKLFSSYFDCLLWVGWFAE